MYTYGRVRWRSYLQLVTLLVTNIIYIPSVDVTINRSRYCLYFISSNNQSVTAAEVNEIMTGLVRYGTKKGQQKHNSKITYIK